MTSPSYPGGASPAGEIAAKAAYQLLADGTALLIDVRDDAEWAAGHAPQAQHMPLDGLDATSLPAHRVIIAVCRSGVRSSRAATHLHAAGMTVRNLTGGMRAWADAGLPVHTDQGQPGTVV